jgi:putative transposase
MPRANRSSCAGQVWHITHRCHQKEFLLKFLRDRQRWRHWLFVATRRYGLSVLNYIATSNHVHILVADQGNEEIALSMQLAAGRTAQDYNRRKNRKGAFWEDRYHATAVQTDHHLVRCLTYIDLNMVRAGAVRHPGDWDVSGYHEIQHPRRRQAIIDHVVLHRLIGISSSNQLKRIHSGWISEAIDISKRDPVWTESVGVGDRRFLSHLKSQLGARGYHREITAGDEVTFLGETKITYKLPF